jgi:hypothetical protein
MYNKWNKRLTGKFWVGRRKEPANMKRNNWNYPSNKDKKGNKWKKIKIFLRPMENYQACQNTHNDSHRMREKRERDRKIKNYDWSKAANWIKY